MGITKQTLRELLSKGTTLESIFEFKEGQNCLIFKMPKYVIITKNQVYESEPEKIVEEQEEKRKLLGLDGDHYVCHFFDSPYSNDFTEETSIENAIQRLAIKDGYDMVQFQNGNYGFVAYYNGIVNGFEIIG